MAKKKSPKKTGMTPNKELLKTARDSARAELPAPLAGFAGITHLGEREIRLPGTKARHPGLGEPGQARPVNGEVEALAMPVDLSTLCVDVESFAHEVVCELADVRAAVVKQGYDSAYSISNLECRMRKLNMSVERLKIELRKRLKNKNKKA